MAAAEASRVVMAAARSPGGRARRLCGGAVDEGVLATGKSTAAACGGWIVFEDEVGQSMTPPRARSWGRVGQTRWCGSEAGARAGSRWRA